jgi:hypothetical protein
MVPAATASRAAIPMMVQKMRTVANLYNYRSPGHQVDGGSLAEISSFADRLASARCLSPPSSSRLLSILGKCF